MDEIRQVSKTQARRILLKRHGLLGDYQYFEKEGVYEYIRKFGCVQYDPIDVCGKNHELVLQARVPNFDKKWVHELLYEDRRLIDWFDKNMSILPIEDWVFFAEARKRAKSGMRNAEEIDQVREDVLALIREKGPVISSDLEYTHKVDWWWAPTSFSRMVLDALYYQGYLIVESKKNTRKSYDLAERYLAEEWVQEQNPFESEHERLKWNVLRRLKSVGLLHLNASYAFIGIHGLKSAERNAIYDDLLETGVIKPILVEGIEKEFYFLAEEEDLFEFADEPVEKRVEFLAPLDNLLWDREIIKEIFEFDYKWEIYTPLKDRQYGYYVLPILMGDALIGRIELKRNRKSKQFDLLGLWFENPSINTEENQTLILNKAKEFETMMF